MSGQPEGSARLTVLGSLALADADARPLEPILTQPKRLAVLLYLSVALPRGFHRRDSLLAMFWPEFDHNRASRSLRQALHFLRRQLPPASMLNRGSNEVRIEPVCVQCDAVLFDTALDHGREEDALAQYGGELLPGFHLSGVPDFNRWLEMERERLRRRAWRAAAFLARRSYDDDQNERATHWARLMSVLAPFDEGAQLEAAVLLANTGDRLGAARLLDETMKRFGKAGVECSPDLAVLCGQIRDGRADLDFRSLADLPVRSAGASQGAARVGSRRWEAPDQRGAGTAPPPDSEAYYAYLRGRHFSRQRTPASMLQALDQYHTAIQLWSEFAAAHAGLAEVWCVLPVYSPYPPAEAYPRAMQHAAKALSLDDQLAEAHAWLALATVCYEWDWAAAERGFIRALELDPSSSDARVPYGLYLLVPTGRFTEGIRELELARQRIPTSPAESTYLALGCYFAREFERAIREARLVVEMNEQFPLAWWVLGMAHEQSGNVSEAIRCFTRAVALTAESPLMLAQLGRAYAVAGERAQADEVLARLRQRGEEVGPTPYFTASVYGALGEVGRALEWLERAYRERVPHLVFLRVGPEMDTLRGEKRFHELLMRLGLGS